MDDLHNDSENEKERILKQYLENVRWLRNHVAPDDIYEFAQQTILAAEYLLSRLSETVDLKKEIETDRQLFYWVGNILSIDRLKEANFEGIIDVSWRLEKQ